MGNGTDNKIDHPSPAPDKGKNGYSDARHEAGLDGPNYNGRESEVAVEHLMNMETSKSYSPRDLPPGIDHFKVGEKIFTRRISRLQKVISPLSVIP